MMKSNLIGSYFLQGQCMEKCFQIFDFHIIPLDTRAAMWFQMTTFFNLPGLEEAAIKSALHDYQI